MHVIQAVKHALHTILAHLVQMANSFILVLAALTLAQNATSVVAMNVLQATELFLELALDS